MKIDCPNSKVNELRKDKGGAGSPAAPLSSSLPSNYYKVSSVVVVVMVVKRGIRQPGS